MIDSYTQPLNGLVEFAKKEPDTVRSMFLDLLRTAAADVSVKQMAIQTFLDKSHQLRAKYFPDSYLYNDDLHSVTGYLFLYDSDHNYLYKATHCRSFADCMEFYDDWGSGKTTKLDVFFRMCDIIKRIEDASYLAINGNGTTELNNLITAKIPGIPSSIAEFDFSSNYAHRNYTHRGWNLTSDEKAHGLFARTF